MMVQVQANNKLLNVRLVTLEGAHGKAASRSEVAEP